MIISRRNWSVLLISSIGVVLTSISALAADSPQQAAAKADKILRSEVPYANAAKAAPAKIDDERFLRRASLDTIGRLPTPEEVTAFALDPAADKRAKVVERLLASSPFGENWSRYWRDVIMYRKTEERAGIVVPALEKYLTDSFNANVPWSEIATAFITASGDATENGACALIMAQQGQPEETVAEVSRIFLGVQIQCAQCHDHPTDRWKREQFHELAAFFPRVASRLQLQQQQFSVVVTDNPPAFLPRGPMAMRRNGTAEHFMSDPKNPQSQGKLMEPVFFATGDKLPVGSLDSDRRRSLAKWTTKKDNPYFAKAFVNRMWSELTGEGFYEPIDDIGPDRTCTAPQTLDYLAGQFAESGYDIKWLFRTIMASELYQLPSSAPRGPEDAPMQHNVVTRLRADQLFDNLLVALEASEGQQFGGGGPGGLGGLYGRGRGPRQQFTTAFGYDPSERRDEIAHSIPQALTMMNSPIVGQAIRGGGRTMLSRLIGEIKDDKALTQELYLRVLGREPSPSELETATRYVKTVGTRTEAFEDILWGLVNSAEFLHRT